MNSTDVMQLLGSTAEQQLVRIASTFDSLSEGLQLLDPDWRYLYVNQAVCRQAGKTREELLGHTLLEVFPSLEHTPLFAKMREAMATRQPVSFLNEFTPEGEGSGWFDVRIEAHEHGLVLFTRDVTQQRRLELEREREQKFEALGHLAGTVAHDFNNLLTVITNSSQLVLDELAPGSSQAEELQAALDATTRARALAQQLLTFARCGASRLEVVSLEEVTRGSQRILARMVPPSIRLVIDAGDGPMRVRAHQGLLEQVLMNLVLNACNASPDGGEVLVELRAQASATSRQGVLRVVDSGKGMDEATRARVFEPFFTTRGKEGGTGLGLATVAAIVARLAGEVTVESEVGRGSTFTISLPLVG